MKCAETVAAEYQVVRKGNAGCIMRVDAIAAVITRVEAWACVGNDIIVNQDRPFAQFHKNAVATVTDDQVAKALLEI